MLQPGSGFVLPAQAGDQIPSKRGDAVRATADQLHQLNIVTVESYPFRVEKYAVGLIALNEDESTVVSSPFAGRVTRLIAKIGDKVRRGDPLLEIDSRD